jgi:hypothetical protein
MIKWILTFLGGGPLKTIADALTKAHADALNATTEQEKVAANERIQTLTQSLADVANARSSASTMPWWMAAIAFGIGFSVMLHVALIFIGTSFQPLIVGGSFSWMLHIPGVPPPFDKYEAQVIGFFYGFASIVVGSRNIARRKP